MTPGASVSFFRPEFDNFLYAPIGGDRNEMSLSVLSALSRLNLDPWQEAAELSELPKDTATRRLASLIARLPGGRWTQADSGAIADRLIELLPHRSSSKPPLAGKTNSFGGVSDSTVTKILICAALGLTALIIVSNRQPSGQGDHADRLASPPQTAPR
jgi:hypothetical protein